MASLDGAPAGNWRRLFFGFWPGEPVRLALSSARNRLFPLAGRPVDLAGVHVTAAFLGAVSPARVPALLALAGPVHPLTITFDRLELWPRPRVLVAATGHVRDDLRECVDGLWRRLDRLGFARETRPFRPHVTLVREVRSVREGLRWEPLAWPVDRLSLIESVPLAEGVAYRPVTPADTSG